MPMHYNYQHIINLNGGIETIGFNTHAVQLKIVIKNNQLFMATDLDKLYGSL